MKALCIAVMSILILVPCRAGSQPEIFMHETFESLERWEPLTSSEIEHTTRYEIVEDKGNPVLKAVSQSSASWLLCKKEYDLTAYPVLSWRWKVENVYEQGDASRKDTDDVPFRLYVSIPYDPDKAGLFTRMKFSAIRSVYGRYPPLASLCYIWANRPQPDMFTNPYNDRTRMIPLREGSEKAGQWVEERVQVLEDYKKAFGELPPGKARLGILVDSDNTGEQTVSYIDDMVIRAEE